MTKEEFWDKWEPCDRPPIMPSQEAKDEFMADLQSVINAAVKEAIAKSRARAAALKKEPD
jgi:hypothetical protein